MSYNYLYSHKEHLQISTEMFKSEIILCSNSLHTLRKPLKVLWFGFRRAHCAYRAHKAQFSWQCIADSGSFMPVKWHFSWVHTGSFLPAPVFCESLWTWLCWSRRRNAVGAVSEWSNSAVQFLCQGFPEIFFFLLAPTSCTNQVKSFVFSSLCYRAVTGLLRIVHWEEEVMWLVIWIPAPHFDHWWCIHHNVTMFLSCSAVKKKWEITFARWATHCLHLSQILIRGSVFNLADVQRSLVSWWTVTPTMWLSFFVILTLTLVQQDLKTHHITFYFSPLCRSFLAHCLFSHGITFWSYYSENVTMKSCCIMHQ